MTRDEHRLFPAFREDHARLGRGFARLAECLRGGELDEARRVADQVDRDAGAHIAFEEEDFYPALAALLARVEVARMYVEHQRGLALVQTLTADVALPAEESRRLLADCEVMAGHIAECSELFEVLGRIPPDQQDHLLQQLLRWRQRAPRWSAYAVAKQRT
jgi:hypothetical protein